jgi:hypothetical protein
MDDDGIKPVTNQGFFTYVFKLSKFKQEDLMNIVQYSILSVAPVMFFIYFTKNYFPTVNDTDSSLYIFIITFIELIFMIVGIFFIDRMVNFIPTYSGKYYETINLTTIILIFVLFMLLTHGGFRQRTSILLKRFDHWFTIDDIIAKKLGFVPKPFDITRDDLIVTTKNGKNNKANNNSQNKGNTVNLSNTEGLQMNQQYATPAPLPTQGPVLPNPMSNYGGTMPTQQAPNFNSMYAGPTTPLVNAHTPGMDDQFIEPMAANDALGGGSSWAKW